MKKVWAASDCNAKTRRFFQYGIKPKGLDKKKFKSIYGHESIFNNTDNFMISKSAAKRKLILGSAIKIFATKGYQYATIEDIAKEAKIAKGSIHAYFENKLDVLLSIILLFWQRINDMNAKKITSNENPPAALKAIFKTFQDILLHDTQSLYWSKILLEGLPKIHMIKSPTAVVNKKRTIHVWGHAAFFPAFCSSKTTGET